MIVIMSCTAKYAVELHNQGKERAYNKSFVDRYNVGRIVVDRYSVIEEHAN